MNVPAAMFSTHLSVLAKLIRRLNLAYCLSLSDSSFGPEGHKRELLDLRKRASARPAGLATVKTFFYHMKQRGEQTTQEISFSLISRLFLLLALGLVLCLAMFHPNVIICFARNTAYFIIFVRQQPIRSASKSH